VEQRPDSGREKVRPLGEDEGIRRRALAQSRTIPSCVLANASVSIRTHTYGAAARLSGLVGPAWRSYLRPPLHLRRSGADARRLGAFFRARVRS
jgi:hypothetical protein